MRLDIIVVTYNSWKSAEECLKSMIAACSAHKDDVELYFVDNSPDSTDECALKPLVAELSNVHLAALPSNPGFAAGCNFGVRQGTSEWVAMFNPDLVIDSVTLGRILAEFHKVGEKYLSYSIAQNTNSFAHQGVMINRFGWFVDRPRGSAGTLLGPSGGAAIYRREMFEQLGGFDEELFAWGEDADLAIRMSIAGFATGALETEVKHLGGHSIAGQPALTVRKSKLLTANRFTIAARYYSLSLKLRFALFAAVVLASKLPRYIRERSALQLISIHFAGYTRLFSITPSPKRLTARDIA